MLNDKIAEMYTKECCETDDKFPEDFKKIQQNQKVFHALLDIVAGVPELMDVAEQLEASMCSCTRVEAIRAYKMGLATGQVLSGVKS